MLEPALFSRTAPAYILVIKQCTMVAALAVCLTGCASSMEDRRMRDSYGDTEGQYGYLQSPASSQPSPQQTYTALAIAAALLTASGPRVITAGPSTDYSWAWDLQRAPYGGVIWVCRGIQTGQYADQQHCAYQIKADAQWPGY